MRILNLGAGVQSTAVFLLSHEGRIEAIDHAIFADTQEEPQAVYDHLEWMRRIAEPVPLIHIATAGKLGDDLLKETAPSIPHKDGAPYKPNHRHRFASIPAFTGKHHDERQGRDPCNEGIIRRQCTKEYKIEVVEKVLRRDILGLKPRQHLPKNLEVVQIFGISLDEKGRAKRIQANWDKRNLPHWRVQFPLIEMQWTRTDCLEYLKSRVPHIVTRSACVFCPFKSASEWLATKAQPKEWARALEIDRGLRSEGKAVNARMDQSIYLHRSLIPLEMVDLEAEAKKEAARKSRPLFDLMECEGMCGPYDREACRVPCVLSRMPGNPQREDPSPVHQTGGHIHLSRYALS